MTIPKTKVRLTKQEVMAHNFLLANLLQAEGLTSFLVALIWRRKADMLLKQIQDAHPILPFKSGALWPAWIDRAVDMAKAVRGPDRAVKKEFEGFCKGMRNTDEMSCWNTVHRQPNEGEDMCSRI